METGADRILTSGGAQTAVQGGRNACVVLLIGEQIAPSSWRAAVSTIRTSRPWCEKTAVREIHVGLRTAAASPMRYRNESISMGITEGNEYQRYVVLEEQSCAKLVRASLVRLDPE